MSELGTEPRDEREPCWCDDVEERDCVCGGQVYYLGNHNLNCPQHRIHQECYATR